MFQQRGFTKRALLAASALCAFSATAAWPQQAGRTPESSANFKFECQNDEVCAQSNPEREKMALAELEAVKEWFKTMGYPESLLPDRPDFSQGKVINITDGSDCETPGAPCIRYDLISSRPRKFNVPLGVMNGEIDNFLGSIVHEYTHTLLTSREERDKNYEIKWLNEAIADAVEMRWTSKKNGAPFPKVHPKYQMDLDETFYNGLEGGYEKSP